jgi:hypothetical protein
MSGKQPLESVSLDWTSPELSLHQEFSSLISLLSLITEDEGHPQPGHSTLRFSYEEKVQSAHVVNDQVKRDPLQAISTLLVREHEVVAVAACKPPIARFAVIANPDQKDEYSFGQKLYTLVPPVQSYWAHVRKDKWYALTRCVSHINIVHWHLCIILPSEKRNPSNITSLL